MNRVGYKCRQCGQTGLVEKMPRYCPRCMSSRLIQTMTFKNVQFKGHLPIRTKTVAK